MKIFSITLNMNNKNYRILKVYPLVGINFTLINIVYVELCMNYKYKNNKHLIQNKKKNYDL